MRTFVADLESTITHVQSKFYNIPKLNRELPADYEERTWRERLHYTEDGNVFIPAMMFKNCVAAAAQYMSMKIPGKSNATYTKHFEAGVFVLDPLVLPIKKDEVHGNWLHVPSDGKRGGTKRVLKCFPHIEHWEGEVTFYIADEIITKDVFEQVLTAAGTFIGIGAFRPRNNGICGRFKVRSVREEMVKPSRKSA